MAVFAKEIKPPLLLLLLIHHNQQRHSCCPFYWSSKSGLDIVPPFDYDPEEQVSRSVRSKEEEENRILWWERGGGAKRPGTVVFKAVGTNGLSYSLRHLDSYPGCGHLLLYLWLEDGVTQRYGLPFP